MPTEQIIRYDHAARIEAASGLRLTSNADARVVVSMATHNKPMLLDISTKIILARNENQDAPKRLAVDFPKLPSAICGTKCPQA